MLACSLFLLDVYFKGRFKMKGNMPNKRIFVSEKLGCNDTNADLHMEEESTRFNLCYNRPYVHICFSSYKFS